MSNKWRYHYDGKSGRIRDTTTGRFVSVDKVEGSITKDKHGYRLHGKFLPKRIVEFRGKKARKTYKNKYFIERQINLNYNFGRELKFNQQFVVKATFLVEGTVFHGYYTSEYGAIIDENELVVMEKVMIGHIANHISIDSLEREYGKSIYEIWRKLLLNISYFVRTWYEK